MHYFIHSVAYISSFVNNTKNKQKVSTLIYTERISPLKHKKKKSPKTQKISPKYSKTKSLKTQKEQILENTERIIRLQHKTNKSFTTLKELANKNTEK